MDGNRNRDNLYQGFVEKMNMDVGEKAKDFTRKIGEFFSSDTPPASSTTHTSFSEHQSTTDTQNNTSDPQGGRDQLSENRNGHEDLSNEYSNNNQQDHGGPRSLDGTEGESNTVHPSQNNENSRNPNDRFSHFSDQDTGSSDDSNEGFNNRS